MRRGKQRAVCRRLAKPIPLRTKKEPRTMPGRRKQKVEDRGLEPVPSSPQKTPLLKQGNAQYNALLGDDERLRLLLEAWPTLSKEIQQQIMLLVG